MCTCELLSGSCTVYMANARINLVWKCLWLDSVYTSVFYNSSVMIAVFAVHTLCLLVFICDILLHIIYYSCNVFWTAAETRWVRWVTLPSPSTWGCNVHHTPPDISGAYGISDILGLDFAVLLILFFILSHFMGKLCLYVDFCNQTWGWQNDYIRPCRLHDAQHSLCRLHDIQHNLTAPYSHL